MFELPPNFYCSLTALLLISYANLINFEKHKQFYVSVFTPFYTGIIYDTHDIRGENGLTFK